MLSHQIDAEVGRPRLPANQLNREFDLFARAKASRKKEASKFHRASNFTRFTTDGEINVTDILLLAAEPTRASSI